MRKLTPILLASVLLFAAVAYAQSNTITVRVTVDGAHTSVDLTARQVRLLNRQLADANISRVANEQAVLTMGDYLLAGIRQRIREDEQQAESHEQAEACAAFAKLTAAKRNAILAELEGKAPCR